MRRVLIGATAALAALGLGATALGAAGGATGGAAATSDAALFAALSGNNEIGGGDRDGRGATYVFVTSTKICFGIAVNSVGKPTAAHIHRGGRRVNGPVVVALKAPSAGNNGQSSGCASTSATLRNEIKRTPGGFYVNVHNTQFPNGAVRGQLRK